MQTNSIFDYVRYDEKSNAKQMALKAAAQKVEAALIALDDALCEYQDTIEMQLEPDPSSGCNPHVERAYLQADAIFPKVVDADDVSRCPFTALEESYMWCGKAIRDEQIARNGSAELLEERVNS